MSTKRNILVYSVFEYWTAGKGNLILPWWYVYARELIICQHGIWNHVLQKIHAAYLYARPKGKMRPLKTEMSGAPSDFPKH